MSFCKRREGISVGEEKKRRRKATSHRSVNERKEIAFETTRRRDRQIEEVKEDKEEPKEVVVSAAGEWDADEMPEGHFENLCLDACVATHSTPDGAR
ncbi:hypothetical protein WN51_12575 [Melipona quadrifasciata]|uniref:Uncharacterized protein n=1 Tax=Melipona quadrifasciata TaxID=166423 RepID=A0A0M9A2D4_9HYME|nr:hypothetical protein WN51_12575 [Melipona quadrifasciata]